MDMDGPHFLILFALALMVNYITKTVFDKSGSAGGWNGFIRGVEALVAAAITIGLFSLLTNAHSIL